ncbi:hypothetical protein [Flavobacterium sp.]|mgnify:CR=1 FL=1|uniref:hypothetical protein n=1 Tax=Flavobacterium sp. TaxID=239 RepID=UPI002FDB2F78
MRYFYPGLLFYSQRKWLSRSWLTLVFLLVFGVLHSQSPPQSSQWLNVYTLHPNRSHQFKLVVPGGSEKIKFKAGWTLTETRAGITIQRVLEQDTLVTIPRDRLVPLTSPWKMAALKISTESPGKIYFQPVPFLDPSDAFLNQTLYLSLPVNEELWVTHWHTKWSAITIPFSIRPAIGNRIRSQVTSEFKVGTAFSLNHDWEFYKNRGLAIKTRTYGFSFGLGFGLGRVKLDEGSTLLSGASYENDEEGLILFVTPGLGFNIRGFKILAFYGWDLGLTQNTNDWNYNGKPYLGVGLGFDFWTLKR